MEYSVRDTLIAIIMGDITTLAVDAIVNAANENLVLGSGVAGAIRENGGPSIQNECDRIGGTPVGTAVITGAGMLPAKQIIHAVGPVWGTGDEERKLAEATRSALDLAEKHHIRSLAFPAISTGVFGFPAERCARVMISTTIAFAKGGGQLDRVIFCLFSNDMYNVFEKELSRYTSD